MKKPDFLEGRTRGRLPLGQKNVTRRELDQFSLVLSAQTQEETGQKADNQDKTFEN